MNGNKLFTRMEMEYIEGALQKGVREARRKSLEIKITKKMMTLNPKESLMFIANFVKDSDEFDEKFSEEFKRINGI